MVSLKYIYALEKPFNNYTWKKLLFFEDGKFQAQQDYFYLNKLSLEKEWEASIVAIKNGVEVGFYKKKFQCIFPARFEFIKKYHPELEDVACPEFLAWKSELNVQEVYLVYASSYVSNPASMFGHTFLRLSQGQNSRVRALSDYSVGFMAITDNQDNPLTYAVKGITGGYLGQYDIKPFYMNVGLYQNSEDRDLWQYKIDLTKEQIEFFVKILWELSQNTGFSYYFLTQNCSTQILKTLSILDDSFNVLEEKFFLFGHPIETLKWISKKLKKNEAESTVYYQSINKQLRGRLSLMNSGQRRSFKEGRVDLKKLQDIHDEVVLDALIDYWKFENYKSNANLDKNSDKLMNTALVNRSKIRAKDQYQDEKIDLLKNPLKFHDPNFISIGALRVNSKNYSILNYKLGYHSLIDNPSGHDGFSFIDYLGVRFVKNEKIKYEEIKFFEINSFSPYLNELKQFSWNLESKIVTSSFLMGGSLGVSIFKLNQIYNTSLGLEVLEDKGNIELIPQIKLLYRYSSKDFVLVMQNKVTKDEFDKDLSIELAKYFMKDKSIKIKFKKDFLEISTGINF